MRLGDLLMRAGVVTQEQLDGALEQQSSWGGKLGSILVRMGALSEDLLVKALSRQLNIPRADLSQINIPPPLRSRLTKEVCEEYGVIPVRYDPERRSILLAVSDPFNVVVIDDLSRRINLRIDPVLAGEGAIVEAIRAQYGESLRGPGDTGIKLLNNQGSTLVKKRDEIVRQGGPPRSPAPAQAPIAPPPNLSNQVIHSTAPETLPPAVDDARLAELKKLANKQSKAIRAVLELLIEKGLLTREEYLAWVNRR
jgi:hypothetical protein